MLQEGKNTPWYYNRAVFVCYYYCHYFILFLFIELGQEPITRSLHLCCTLESTLSSEKLFLEQAFSRKSIVSEGVNPRTLSAIVVKASSEHKKSTCK